MFAGVVEAIAANAMPATFTSPTGAGTGRFTGFSLNPKAGFKEGIVWRR